VSERKEGRKVSVGCLVETGVVEVLDVNGTLFDGQKRGREKLIEGGETVREKAVGVLGVEKVSNRDDEGER